MRKRLMLLAVFGLLLAFVTVGFAPIAQGIQRFRTVYTDNIRVSNSATINTLTVTGDLGLTGDLTLPSGYPLAYASADNEIVCGAETVTDTADITTTGLTSISYATAVMATDPLTTASIVTIDAPTGITLTLNVWESDFTVGTSGAVIYYCAVGTQ